MLGKITIAILMAWDNWAWKWVMLITLFYCMYLFATSVDTYLTQQLEWYRINLGM